MHTHAYAPTAVSLQPFVVIHIVVGISLNVFVYVFVMCVCKFVSTYVCVTHLKPQFLYRYTAIARPLNGPHRAVIKA